jgi:hypothetical protein
MSSLEATDSPTSLATPSARGPLGVYAVAAGLASAIPIPVLDSALGGLARGAAMRRVAERHGVRLRPDARELLAQPMGASARGRRGRIVRAVALRVLAPLRVPARIEEVVETILSAALLDHYLTRADRPAGAPLHLDEARRIRRAIDAAGTRTAAASVRSMPRSLLDAVRDAGRAAVGFDDEDRTPAERTIDTLLDALADAQRGVSDDLRRAFDAALRADDEGSDAGAAPSP